MLDYLKKKTDPRAEVVSVTEDAKVNPGGSTFSGMARNGQATQLAGTGDRFQVCFSLSDGSVFQSTVSSREAARFAVGAVGKLTWRADAVVKWEPGGK